MSRQISCEESWLRLLAWELTPIMQHLHHSKLHPSKSTPTVAAVTPALLSCDTSLFLCILIQMLCTASSLLVISLLLLGIIG